MKETITCEVNNTADNKPMNIITEWNDRELSIIVFRSEMPTLISKTTIDEMYASLQPKKTREEYFKDTKNDLSGNDESVQFSLRSSRLTWKKGMWMRGAVTMQDDDDIDSSSSTITMWIIKYSTLQKTTAKLKKENEILRNKTEQLTTMTKEMERMKMSMEDTLYKQFLLLLNSKKRKIRELEEKLNDRRVVDDRTVYEENTDDSADELEKLCSPKKKSKREESWSPIASTSRRSLRSRLESGSESEDEIVLRYDESQTQCHDKIEQCS